MRLASTSSGEQAILVQQDETAALSQTLNEVLHGFHLADREQRIGAVREQAEALLQRLLKVFYGYIGSEEREMTLSKEEAEIIEKAAFLCLEHIKPWEFSTRIGASVAEVNGYLEVIKRLTD